MRPITVAAGVTVFVMAIIAWGRLAPLPPDRAEAVKMLMKPPPPVAGRDASDALWVLPYDVPEARRAEVAAAHRRALDARNALLADGRKEEAARVADPLERFPPFGPAEAWMCDGATGCLDRVRANPAGYARSVAGRARQIAAVRAIADHDGARFGLRWLEVAKPPEYGHGRRLHLTAMAERFVRGEEEAAIADTCRDLAGWRRLGADNDHLTGTALGAVYAGEDAQMLAAMLATRPASAPLPPECESAMAPTVSRELDLCPAMHGEFLIARDGLVRHRWEPENLLDRVVLATRDDERSASMMAPYFARFCSAGLRAHAAADRPARAYPHPRPKCWDLEGAVYPLACVTRFPDNSRDYLDDQLDRRTDLAAKLALLRTWIWLRAQSADPRDWPALLRKRPAALGLRREPRVEAGTLVMDQHYTGFAKTFALPLPTP